MADKKSPKQIAQENAKDAYYLGMKRAQGKGNLTNKINREIESNLPERGVRPFLAGRDRAFGSSGYLKEPQDEALARAKAEANMQRYGADITDPGATRAEKVVQNLRDAKENRKEYGMKKGGSVKKYAKGGDVVGKKDPRRPAGDTGIADIYTADKGQPPMDPDMGSARSRNLVNRSKPGAAAREQINPKGKGKAQSFESSKEITPLKKGGTVSSASSRADGCAVKGKTKGRMV